MSPDLVPVEDSPLRANLTYEEWVEEGRRLGRYVRGLQWRVHAWVEYGETHYGERFAQALDETGYSTQSLLNIMAVGRAFPEYRRREQLSFGHHDAVTGLTPEAQDAMLDAAEQGAWSVTRLRQEVRANGGRPAPTSPTPKEELLAILDACVKDTDPERAHAVADAALIDYIADPAVTRAYERITRWYGG